MIKLSVNNKEYEVDVDPSTPLLWVIREALGMTGTKFGCGVAQCGACTVLVDGRPTRSCITRASVVAGKNVQTIEGLDPDLAGPLQEAWIAEEVPQCGYCQSGQIMSAAALLRENPSPDDNAIERAMSGNICRCGTYQRIRKAIQVAAELKAKGGAS